MHITIATNSDYNYIYEHDRHLAKELVQRKIDNQEIYMKTLYSRFTYIGKRNYVSYAYRVANVFDSKNIKSQVKDHFSTFNQYLEKKMDRI